MQRSFLQRRRENRNLGVLGVYLLTESCVDVKLLVILLLESYVLTAEGVILFGLPVDNLLPFLVGFSDILKHSRSLLFADKEYGNQSTATEQYCNELDD